ncbi:MAG: acetate/propionate family kinase [Oscillospiraceae bacterium]|nr:acetate/propionate family kinase [Oscillospiraceae bacterium]
MNILICNVGSTSLKYQLFAMEDGERVIAAGGAERVGAAKSLFYRTEEGKKVQEECVFPTHREAIQKMLSCLPAEETVDCVGFKVVHAKGVTGVQELNDGVLAAMEAFNSVAPAHNPPYLAAIRQFRALMPGVPLIGSFETAFHANMPPEASLYSIPWELTERHAIHRYGFHGASHEYMTTWAAEKTGRSDLKLISCHLGGSGSLTAVDSGRSIDTTMGLSLQCGVMQNNRIADIDPYIIFYLVEECGMTLEEVKVMLQTKSGLLGMSGVSNDLRDVEEAAAAGNERAANAVRAYTYGIKKYIGSYAAALGGLDVITFGGGIGRNSATVREQALAGLGIFGVELDPEKNRNAKGGDDISRGGSRVRIFVVDTNEEIVVARKAAKLLRAGGACHE